MFPFKSLTDFALSADEVADPRKLVAEILRFKSTFYDVRPFTDNDGGMGLESAFFLWKTIYNIKPELVIECGVWKGFTTFLFDQVPSVKRIFCFDPAVKTPEFIQYKSNKAVYSDLDWASTIFSYPDPSNSVAFFDDHQDQLERLVISYARGFRFVIFDDNYFFGGGGHAGLADYMRKIPDVLSSLVDTIYISPPLLQENKGIKPLLESNSSIPDSLTDMLNEQNNYNWLTLVQLKQNPSTSRSQIPSEDYIKAHYCKQL